MTATVVLLNPRAAGGRAAALAQPVARWLQKEAPAVPLVESTSTSHAQDVLARLPAGSRVVVVGGDGTLHHLLSGAVGHGHALGLVPLGSGNDSARAWGVHPAAWQAALRHALSGAVQRIDTGELLTRAGRTLFVSSLCAGFDAAVCARVVAGPRWLGGLPRYLWGTVCELAVLERRNLLVRSDGLERHRGAALFASTCNTPTFGSGMPAVPDARIADGRLDLLLAGAFGRVGALRMLPRLLRGTHFADARVSTFSFEHLEVTGDAPIPLAADGEPLAAADAFRVRVLAGSLTVVVGPGPAAL